MPTFAPLASVVPALRESAITRPFRTLAERAFVVLPTEQFPCLIAARAARTVAPVRTFGTTHR